MLWVLYIILQYGVIILQDSVEKDRRIRELSASHDSEVQKLDTQLCSTRLQLDHVRAEWVWYKRYKTVQVE